MIPRNRALFNRRPADSSIMVSCNNPRARLLWTMSPTVLRDGGFVVMIYYKPLEHDPPHVHVWKAGTEARIGLGDEQTPPVAWDWTMRRTDVARALRLVDDHQMWLLAEWRRINGAS